MTAPSDAGGPGNPDGLEPISRIEAALARLGAEHEPPVGWEARVLAATAPPPRRAWWWLAIAMKALKAATRMLQKATKSVPKVLMKSKNSMEFKKSFMSANNFQQASEWLLQVKSTLFTIQGD